MRISDTIYPTPLEKDLKKFLSCKLSLNPLKPKKEKKSADKVLSQT